MLHRPPQKSCPSPFSDRAFYRYPLNIFVTIFRPNLPPLRPLRFPAVYDRMQTVRTPAVRFTPIRCKRLALKNLKQKGLCADAPEKPDETLQRSLIPDQGGGKPLAVGIGRALSPPRTGKSKTQNELILIASALRSSQYSTANGTPGWKGLS